MWSGDTSVTDSPAARGSKKRPLKQMLLEAQRPTARLLAHPQSKTLPVGSAAGRGWAAAGWERRQGELLPGSSQVPGVGKRWQPLRTACSRCLPHSRPPETPTCCRQLEAVKQLLGYHKHGHNCSLFSLPGGRDGAAPLRIS